MPIPVASRSTALKHNPFSTKFVRPGAIEFYASSGLDLNSIADELMRHKIGQIVGPHGCGKTTLTHGLESLLGVSGQPFTTIRRITVRSKNDLTTSHCDQDSAISHGELLIVDGFKRLPWLHRRMLIANAKRSKTGLLITTHQRVRGIEVLAELTPSLESLIHVVRHLKPDPMPDPTLIEDVFKRTNGNIRESLMAMYDWFESAT